MYYVPDGTEMCGFYECEECANRFLSLKIGPKLVCPYCGEEPDMEIGPDEEMPVAKETAKLLMKVMHPYVPHFLHLLRPPAVMPR